MESCRSKLPAVTTAYRAVSRFRAVAIHFGRSKTTCARLRRIGSISDQSALSRILLTTSPTLSSESSAVRPACITNGQALNHERRLVTWGVYKRRGLAKLPELHALEA